MNNHLRLQKSQPEAGHGSLISYVAGFVFSVLLTVGAYVIVSRNIVPGSYVMYMVAGLAVLQLLVQLLFFLHLGRESKPRWNLTVFIFAALVVGILVFGSIWIMQNLRYNMMGSTPSETDTNIVKDEGMYQ